MKVKRATETKFCVKWMVMFLGVGVGMYKCDIHGGKDNEWCDECKKILQCNCSDRTTTRFKDLHYDCNTGEKTTTLYLEHCENCGEIFNANVQ